MVPSIQTILWFWFFTPPAATWGHFPLVLSSVTWEERLIPTSLKILSGFSFETGSQAPASLPGWEGRNENQNKKLQGMASYTATFSPLLLWFFYIVTFSPSHIFIFVTDGFYAVFFHLKPTDNCEVGERGRSEVLWKGTNWKKKLQKRKTECWERLGNSDAGLGQAWGNQYF